MDERRATLTDDERRRVEAEFVEKLQEEMRRVSVHDYLRQLLMSLSSMAFQHLGLTPETEGERDFAQSRLAIDAFGALVEVVASNGPAEEVSLYRSTLHQMRLAYVAAVERGAAAPANADQASANADQASANADQASANADQAPAGPESTGGPASADADQARAGGPDSEETKPDEEE